MGTNNATKMNNQTHSLSIKKQRQLKSKNIILQLKCVTADSLILIELSLKYV